MDIRQWRIALLGRADKDIDEPGLDLMLKLRCRPCGRDHGASYSHPITPGTIDGCKPEWGAQDSSWFNFGVTEVLASRRSCYECGAISVIPPQQQAELIAATNAAMDPKWLRRAVRGFNFETRTIPATSSQWPHEVYVAKDGITAMEWVPFEFASAKLADSLAREINLRCRLTGSFTLRSGRIAAEYFDKYLFESDPKLLKAVADCMAALVPKHAQMLGGLELGGVPLATMVGQATGMPVLFVRKAAKQYGTCRLAEGGYPDGWRIVLIEDVITSGGAVLQAAAALRDMGATVTDVICAIDREEGGREALAAAGLTLHAVMTRHDLDQTG